MSHKFYPDIGGIESVSEMLADEFVKHGHEVRIMTWSKQEADKPFKYSVIRKPSFSRIIKELLWTDIVFENNPCLRLSWPNIFVRKPLVVALHTWIRTIDEKIKLPQKIKFFWLKRADKVIACSDALRRGTFSEAITIGNPYNHKLFRQLNTKHPTKDYVFLGRLVSDKGVSLAIQAFHMLLQKLPAINANSTLTIVGDGDEKDSLEHQARKLGISDKIVFVGKMRGEPLVELLNDHKYMLIPSLWDEPFGIVALEGMACGCIPIVSNGGGLPDAVGNAGIIFEKGNVESLTNCMIDLKSNSTLEKTIHSAMAAHLKKHEADSVSKKYLEVLDKIIKAKTSR